MLALVGVDGMLISGSVMTQTDHRQLTNICLYMGGVGWLKDAPFLPPASIQRL